MVVLIRMSYFIINIHTLSLYLSTIFFFTQIPGYILYKVGPMAFSFLKPSAPVDDLPPEATSKRQQKLKARQEKGDSRVKSVNVRR